MKSNIASLSFYFPTTLITGVSERWIQTYVNKLYTSISKKVEVWQKKGRLTIQCDEMWRQQSGGIIPPDFALSFVGNKKNKHLFWLALDVETKEIVGGVGRWQP